MTVLSPEAAPAVVSIVRTPIGRRAGALSAIPATVLGGAVIREAVGRARVEPEHIDDVVMGCTLAPEGNPARVALLEGGLPDDVPGLTIDRQCGSGINALVLAAQGVVAGGGVYVAGGMESMSREPFQLERSERAFPAAPPAFIRRALSTSEIGDPTMGNTAENLAARYGITRGEQDDYALRSQRLMAEAVDAGLFADHMIAVDLPDGSRLERDEHPRPGTKREALAKLRPVFASPGTVTAGNASGINDGAAAAVLMSAAEAQDRGLDPICRIVGWTVAGVDPNVMGIGPVPAIRRLLADAGLGLSDVDHIELNEAFAVQVLACARELNLPMDRLNTAGGAIAHGHPIAATGTMLIAKAASVLRARGLRRAIVAACIGGGQGIAMLLER